MINHNKSDLHLLGIKHGHPIKSNELLSFKPDSYQKYILQCYAPFFDQIILPFFDHCDAYCNNSLKI
jgi:hypothetical protein